MIDGLRAKWREELFSLHDWKHDRHRDSPGGALDAIWLEPDPNEAPYRAVFKPTCRRCLYPAAAREKIAADLGFDLKIPVAPVLLCDSGKRFGAEQEECCVSLVTHPVIAPWSAVFTEAILASDIGKAASEDARDPLSRIAVFDLWIGNPDRDNLGNMVYGDDPSMQARKGIYAFDHDLAMGGSANCWKDGGWASMAVMPFPKFIHRLLDKEVMLHAVSVIHNLPEDRLRACVDRIPDRYMSPLARNDTVNGLLNRKQPLAALVLQYFQEG